MERHSTVSEGTLTAVKLIQRDFAAGAINAFDLTHDLPKI